MPNLYPLESLAMQGRALDFAIAAPYSSGVCSIDPEPAPEKPPAQGDAASLSLEEISNLPDVLEGQSITGLKAALKAEREAREAAAKRVKAYEQLGDPDEINRLKQKIKEQAEFEERVRAQASAQVAEERQKYEPALKAEREAREATELQLQAFQKKSKVKEWFFEKGVMGVPSEFENFYTLTGHLFAYDPATDSITQVTDRGGKVIFDSGEFAKPDHIMLTMRKGEWGNSLAACFEPFNRATGGGMPSSSGINRGQDWKNLSSTDKYAAGFKS